MNKINLPENFQELTSEQAATMQGGAQIRVFTDTNFQGESLLVNSGSAGQQFQFTGNLDNSISSAQVISGTWDLRSNPDGTGVGTTLSPGNYSDFSAFKGASLNDVVSLAITAIA